MKFRPPEGFIEELLTTEDGQELSYLEAIEIYGELRVQQAVLNSEIRRHRSLPKLSGYPPTVFVSHRWDSFKSRSRATLLAIELQHLGFNVFMDQLGPPRFDKLKMEVPRFVSEVVNSHYFLAVSTPAYEVAGDRPWIYEEQRLAFLEAADLRLALVRIAQDGDDLPSDPQDDIVIDVRNSLAWPKGDTNKLRRLLCEAGFAYQGPQLKEADQTRLRRMIQKVTQLCDGGDYAKARKILSYYKPAFSWTQEWKLQLARTLAGLGQIEQAADLALELADLRTGSTANTVIGACFVLEEIGFKKEALEYWTPILGVFRTPARHRMRGHSSVYRGAHAVVGSLLEDLGETEGAFNHFRFLIRAEKLLDPTKAADLYNHMGHIRLFSERNPKEALPFFKKSVSLDPTGPDAPYNLIVCLCRLGQYDDALEAAKQAMEMGLQGHLLSQALSMISMGDHTSVELYGAPKTLPEEGEHLMCDKCGAIYSCDDSTAAICVACGGRRSFFFEACAYCDYDGFVRSDKTSDGFLCPICVDGALKPRGRSRV